MTHILLLYPPFCTPASPPYSIASLKSTLLKNRITRVSALDLNLFCHDQLFPEFKIYCRKGEWEEYSIHATDFRRSTKEIFASSNTSVLNGNKPLHYQEMMEKILSYRADIVCFSVVYSSQAHSTLALLKGLKEEGVNTVIGGPAAHEKLREQATSYFTTADEFISSLSSGTPVSCNHASFESGQEYFTPLPVLPLKTSNTCSYKGCAFCSHYSSSPYQEYDLKDIEASILQSGQKLFFLIDDIIPTPRLLDLAALFKKMGITWCCQLRPTEDLDKAKFRTLRESGLAMIIWGVESGNDRVLTLMQKGTKTGTISRILKESHQAGIANIVYIMFGFPGETKEEFISTIRFLEDHSPFIDLVSSSLFGLQKGSIAYQFPERFGISSIQEKERTVLPPKISYSVDFGLSGAEAALLKKRYRRTIEKLSKFPREMNFFREHMLIRLQHKI